MVVWCLPASVEKWQLETWDQFLLHDTSWYFMILPTARATMVPSKNDMPLIPLMRPKKLLPNLSPGGSTRVNRTPLWPTPQRLRHGCGGCWGGGMFKLNITRTSSPGRRMSQIDARLEWDCPKNWNFEPKYDGGRARWLHNSSKLYNDYAYAPENILGWITGMDSRNWYPLHRFASYGSLEHESSRFFLFERKEYQCTWQLWRAHALKGKQFGSVSEEPCKKLQNKSFGRSQLLLSLGNPWAIGAFHMLC